MDLIVSFDTTGSMYPCLSEVRRKVESFVSTLFTQVPDLRVGIIAHGDYCDHPRTITELPLSNDVKRICNFIHTVKATTGGDSDECYELVLDNALKADWQSDTKVFVLIADANPHEVGYRYGNYTVTQNWKVLAEKLKERGIKNYAVQCLSHRYQTSFYTTLARIAGTPKLDLHQFSDIIPILTALVYKQQDNIRVVEYGKQLQSEGLLNRNLAQVFNALVDASGLIGGLEYNTKSVDLEAVHPSRFQLLHVDSDTSIKDFVVSTGATFKLGHGFYQLTKRELIQERKEVVLVNNKGDMFSGNKARELIGLPYGERGNVTPNKALAYDVFVQSTSVNRKLLGKTKFLYEA